MKKRLQQWSGILSTAFPTASSPYWRSQPIGRMKSLLAGIFFSASVVGFAFDLLQLPLPPLGRGFFWPLVLGAAAVGTLVTRIKRNPILLFLIVVLIWVVGGLSGLGARSGLADLPVLAFCRAIAHPSNNEAANPLRCHRHLGGRNFGLSAVAIYCERFHAVFGVARLEHF